MKFIVEFAILLAFLVSLVTSSVNVIKRCPMVRPMQGLDLQRV